uniref:Uncharacterized protein n=1 Tax=Haptolina brevifila TaxID=156173 RepID=A0A7S2H2P8_9EUKA
MLRVERNDKPINHSAPPRLPSWESRDSYTKRANVGPLSVVQVQLRREVAATRIQAHGRRCVTMRRVSMHHDSISVFDLPTTAHIDLPATAQPHNSSVEAPSGGHRTLSTGPAPGVAEREDAHAEGNGNTVEISRSRTSPPALTHTASTSSSTMVHRSGQPPEHLAKRVVDHEHNVIYLSIDVYPSFI